MHGPTINQAEYNGGLFDSTGWMRCTGPSLRGHIVNAHLTPRGLAVIGVPFFDLGVARQREFDLDWVVKKAMERLAAAEDIVQRSPDAGLDARRYGELLIKTIKVIDTEGMSPVPWSQIEELVPNASSIVVNMPTDSTDISFGDYRVQTTTHPDVVR